MFSNKVLFTAGLFCAGLTQFIFGASSSLTIFCLVWAVNGLVQGVGWPALSGIVLRWFPKEQRGRAFAVLTASGNLGLVAAPALLSRAMAAAGGSWRGGFYAEGALCAAVAALGFLFLRDAPPAPAAGKAEGAAAAGAARQQQAPAVTVPTDGAAGAAGGARKPGVAAVFMEHIVGRPLFWALCVADVANYLAIKTLSDWAALYGIEARGMDRAAALGLVAALELGGVAGNVVSGVASDALGGRRRLAALLCAGAALPAFAAYLAQTLGPRWDLPLLVVVGAGVNGPRTLGPVAMREGIAPSAGGTAAGLMGLAGQLGATLAGAPVGLLAERHGWEAAMALVAACMGLVVALYCALALGEGGGRKEEEEEGGKKKKKD